MNKYNINIIVQDGVTEIANLNYHTTGDTPKSAFYHKADLPKISGKQILTIQITLEEEPKNDKKKRG